MAGYLQRARTVLHGLLRGRRESPTNERPAEIPPVVSQGPPVPVGANLVITEGALAFVDSATASAEPLSWLRALDAALARNAPLSESALAIVRQQAAGMSVSHLLPAQAADKLRTLLRPRQGLASRLRELHRAGLLVIILPEAGFSRSSADASTSAAYAHAFAGIQCLERLVSEASLTGERFGTMLREVAAPELLVVTLLLHDPGRSKDDVTEPIRAIQTTLDYLQVGPDERRMVEFLLRHRLDMSRLAFRQDTGDPSVIGAFAELFSTEEQLKMLCLLTVADLGAMGPDTLTPWKAELLWRLFVDSYNQMTMTYGDEVIDSHDAALSALKDNRPHDITEPELAAFLEGLPRRYLTLFDSEGIYRHVRLARDMRPDDVHFFLSKKADLWELTVVTLDKPYLFSNICGILAYFDLDILRGHALTSRNALVLDIFQFTDRKGCLVRPALDPLLSDVVAGRADITALLREKGRHATPRLSELTPPVLYFDHDSSPRYTILELVADDAPGLLHRISRVISKHGCVVDLVLISTEGTRAVDVFHLRKDSAKLTDADELALTEDFERMLSGSLQDGL
jgi:[protein-PII] uridylyltransferase